MSNETTTRDEFVKVSEMVGVKERSLFNNDLRMSKTPKENAQALYDWAKRDREAAQSYLDKAERKETAAFVLMKGDEVSNEQ